MLLLHFLSCTSSRKILTDMIINLHILYGISIAYKANNDVVEENVVKKDTDIYIIFSKVWMTMSLIKIKESRCKWITN